MLMFVCHFPCYDVSRDWRVFDFNIAHLTNQWMGFFGNLSNAQGAIISLMMVRMWVATCPATRTSPDACSPKPKPLHAGPSVRLALTHK